MDIKFLEKIKTKDIKVGVVGLGYVGLPLAIEFAKAGYQVLGVDICDNKIEQLKRGESYILDVKSVDIQEYVVNKGALQVSSSYDILKNADTISITVPTPLRKTKDPDISCIVSSMDSLLPILKDRENYAIILESTTYPGTTRELIYDRLRSEYKYLEAGENIFVAFSPERVDPGNFKYNTKNTPKVIGGITSRCTEIVSSLYSNVIDTIIPVGSCEEAEMVKLLENTFRAVNIALVNELLLMCDRMGIDVWRVIDAAKTKPFGFMPFYPGPGIGGHCIPLDPLYLSWKAKSYDFYNRFIELASDINGNMPRFTVNKLHRIMNEHKKCLNGSKVLLLGMSYKKDIDDVRESPGLEIYKILKEEYKADVYYHDPHVPSFEYYPNDDGNLGNVANDRDRDIRNDSGDNCNNKLESNRRCTRIESLEISPRIIQTFDCVVLLVDHSTFDYASIAKNSKIILDTRNSFNHFSDGIDNFVLKKL